VEKSSPYKFGPFELIPEDKLLLCDGEPVSLPPKCFQLLLIFVEEPRRVFTADELLEKVWHAEAELSSLNYTLSTLRGRLRRCSPGRQYVINIPGKGYRFAAVVDPPPGGELTLQPALHQLPTPNSDFVGREKQIETLLAELRRGERAAVIGISGMGGVGKTQLALQVAGRLLDRYSDAQLFIDLRGVGADLLTPAEALAECVRAIRPDVRVPEREKELGHLYRSLLYELRALVVLDNAADGKQVLPLLPPRGCAVIITSRDVLSLPGIFHLSLDQLKPDESRDLVTSIAPRVAPEIADDICSLCGHLPLAIRAAASLLSVTPDMEPSEYVKGLREEHNRLKLLQVEITNIDVEASLGLSYARLREGAARVFRRLAVFPTAFDANAEEVICEDDNHAHLTDLVQRSLVIYDAASKRYRLHDLVRLLAREYSDADEARETGARCAEYYEGVLRNANRLFEQGGGAVAEGLALADLEWSNIQAGQAWAAEWAEAEPFAAELCNAYADAGVSLLGLRLHPREHIAWREAALTAARRLGNRKAEGKHRGYLAEAYRRLGDTHTAMDYHRESLRIARELKDRAAEGIALGGIGNVYDNMGEFRRALESYKKSRAIAREIGNPKREGGALGNIGIAYWRLGELRKAVKCHEEHLAIARKLGDPLGEGYALGNLGLVYLDLGQPRRSIELNSRALQIFQDIGDRHGESAAMGNIGRAYAALGETEKAIDFYDQERFVARGMADLELEAEALNNLGAAYATLKDERRAIRLYKRALAITRKIGNRRIEGDIVNDMSKALKELNRTADAISCAEKALEIYSRIEDPSADEVRKHLVKWRKEQRKLRRK
jgi:tetratricopeptide (TPR) repeat protein/DNA-binding winged helix-turn-helix (wHTH) protein